MTAPIRPFSASQITMWQACPRSYYYRYEQGIKSPATPSLLLGSAIHKAVELWFQGTPIDISSEAGRRALPLLEWAPARDTQGLQIERKISFARGDIEFIGYIDLLHTSPAGLHLIDWKSCSDEKWAKTPADLATDVQANGYAHWATLQTGQAQVPALWAYTRTKGSPKAWAVRHVFAKPDVDVQADRLFSVASLIQRLRNAKAPETEYPQHTSACQVYGGCPYHWNKGGTCNPQPKLGDQAIELPPDPPQGLTMQNNGQNPVAPSPGLADLLARLQAPPQVAPPVQPMVAAPLAPAPGPLASFLLPPEANSPAVQAQPLAAPPLLDATLPEPVTAVATPRPKRGRPPKAKGLPEAVPGSKLDQIASSYATGLAALAEARASIALDRGEEQTFNVPEARAQVSGCIDIDAPIPFELVDQAPVSDAQAYAQGYHKAEAPKPVLDLAALGRALDAFARAWLGVTP